jgi:hypothetical protein
VPVVGQREPCPCGSGKKYKACHGRVVAPVAPTRPFAGLPGEVDWVAMREVVPAATATVALDTAALEVARRRPANDDQPAVDQPTIDTMTIQAVTIATVLPLAWPALRRTDGAVYVGLQTGATSADPSRAAATALLQALDTEPGSPVAAVTTVGDLRLQDVVDVQAPFEVTVHDGFDFWLDGVGDLTDDVRSSLEQANAGVVPTARLQGVDGAYWCRIGERTHLRWVLPHDEEPLLDALARLHAAGASSLGEGTRYIGAFRAHGLLVPVWDLAAEAVADDAEEPAAAFAVRLEEALADTTPLSYEQRRARAGVVSRQVTLR